MENLCLVADRHQGFLQRANLLLHPLCSLETKLDELLLVLIKDLGFGLPLLLQFLCNRSKQYPRFRATPDHSSLFPQYS